jgi:hypothetical protein
VSGNVDNFNAWYVQVLEGLYAKRDAGIAVLMVSLPLLERYLRRKYNSAPNDKMTDAAMNGLCTVFPALQSAAQAHDFWKVYRHGFVHQATVSRSTQGGMALPDGWLTHDIDQPIRVEPNGSFTVHPALFSKLVLDVILRDFATFEADAPALPQVVRRDSVTIPSTYLGTGSGKP